MGASGISTLPLPSNVGTVINPVTTSASAAAASPKVSRGRPKEDTDLVNLATALTPTNAADAQPQTDASEKKPKKPITLGNVLSESTLRSKEGIVAMEAFFISQGDDIAQFHRDIVGRRRGKAMAKEIHRRQVENEEKLKREEQNKETNDTATEGLITQAPPSTQGPSMKRSRDKDLNGDDSEEEAPPAKKKRQLFLEATKKPDSYVAQEQTRAQNEKYQAFLEVTKVPECDGGQEHTQMLKIEQQQPRKITRTPLWGGMLLIKSQWPIDEEDGSGSGSDTDSDSGFGPNSGADCDSEQVTPPNQPQVQGETTIATASSNYRSTPTAASCSLSTISEHNDKLEGWSDHVDHHNWFATAVYQSLACYDATRWLALLSKYAEQNIESNDDTFIFSPARDLSCDGVDDRAKLAEELAECHIHEGFLENAEGELILRQDIQLSVLRMMRLVHDMLYCCAYGPYPTYEYRYVKTDEANTQKFKQLQEKYLELRDTLVDQMEDEMIWDGGLEDYSYEAATAVVEDAFPLMGHLNVTITPGCWNGLLG